MKIGTSQNEYASQGYTLDSAQAKLSLEARPPPPYSVPGLPHVFRIELRLDPSFRTRITTS